MPTGRPTTAWVVRVRNRVLLAGLGAGLVVLGVATVAAPTLAGVIAIPNVPVAIVGGLAGVFGVLVGLRRRDSRVRGAEPPVVEDAVDHPTPGDAFDEQLRGAAGFGVEAARHRRVSRDHLADVAITVLTATEGCTEAEAEQALAQGTWTDDPIAAACFADTPPQPGIRGALVPYLDGRSRYERELVHAVDALQARLSGGRHS